ncbi:MAG: tripartite tricarboxylate transporter substrate-binding protein, partial [Solimonas sp.]
AGVPGYEATIWLGIMAPKGTPQEIVDRLNSEIARIIAQPAIREAWARQGAVPMAMTPVQFDTYVRRDIDKWAKVIQQAGIKAQ